MAKVDINLIVTDYAQSEGRKAYLAGLAQNCPFDTDCKPEWYEAWHKGWLEEYNRACKAVAG